MGKDLKGKELGVGFSQRSDGRYNARATINGVNISIYNFNFSKLRKEFELKKADVIRNEYNHRPNITLDEWFDEWFEIYKSPHLKDKVNRHNYRRRYENTYGKALGYKKIEYISEIDIQRASNQLVDEGYTTRTVNESLSSLRECLNAAIANRIIFLNPCMTVMVKKDRRVEERVVLTEKQQETFMQFAEGRYYYELYYFLFSTGMRVGEMTALQWEDIDFDNNFINVRHSMQTAYVDGEKIMNMTEPKTSTGVRRIPIFDGVKEVLSSWKKKQKECKKKQGRKWRQEKQFCDLVFTTSLGSPVTRYILANDLKRILKSINDHEKYLAEIERRKPVEFPKVHPHAFRHTFCTRCFEKGLQPVFIMRIMGHSNYSTTLSYTHISNKFDNEQTAKAGCFISEVPYAISSANFLSKTPQKVGA